MNTIHQWLQHQDAGTILALAVVTSIVVLYLACRAFLAYDGRRSNQAPSESNIPPVVVNLGILARRCERAATHPSLNSWERISLKIQAETYRDAQLHFLENPQHLDEAEPIEAEYIETSLTMGGVRRG